jgi:hypothetical protein
MTEGVLDTGAQFAEGLVIFRNKEERIVTKAAPAASLQDYPSMAPALDDSLDFAVRVGQHCRADIVSKPFVFGQGLQFFD